MATITVGFCKFPFFLFVLPPFSFPPSFSLPIPDFSFSIDLSCPLND